MKCRKPIGCAVLLAASYGLWATRAPAASWQMKVRADQPGARISPSFYGLMTEEINHAYDGGLYAELVQNRSFKDDANNPAHWSLAQEGAGSITLDKTNGVNAALDVSLRLDVAGPGRVGVANDGFWGIPVRPNTPYRASFYARATTTSPLTVSIESNDGQITLAQATVTGVTGEWQKYAVTLQTGAITPSLHNRLVIATRAVRPGTVWLSFVSLFPPTYHNRPNGNRIDLMDKLAAMQPAFLRFPGGNYVDPGHYEWKITRGPVDQRPGHPGAWSYRASDGLGLLEFFEWCEDLNMEPLLAVTDGRGWLPGDGDVTPLVQDALDEIEYATGSAATQWGAKRIADGHAAPFKVRYVEIGNEDFFDKREVYDARFARFYDAIKAKYPALLLIATRGDVTSRRPDVVDDHIYASAANMLRASHNYDNYNRARPKIFVGEWATTEGSPTPTLTAALGDAAYLTGLERNADVVVRACYAPLLVNVNPGARQWGTNLIGYDALRSYGSPSYYMQVMFNRNKGDVVLPLEFSAPGTLSQPAPPRQPHGAVGVGTWLTQAEFKDINVTQDNKTLLQANFAAGDTGWKESAGTWKTQDGVLAQSSNGQLSEATVGNPDWTDYTYSLKARKTGGAEGFLIPFHVQDEANFVWWNIGGWANTRTQLERSVNGDKTPLGASAATTVETGRWYDIRIEVKGRQIRCYLDGKLITTATDAPVMPNMPIYASATREDKSGDIILKVVNVAAEAQSLQINVQGGGRIGRTAVGQVLSGQPGNVNTTEQPTKVAPQTVRITGTSKNFTHEFPAHSVSVIRLKDR